MVHLFGRRAGHDESSNLVGALGKISFNVKVRSISTLTIRLNSENSPAEFLILRILFFKILNFYFVGKPISPPLVAPRSQPTRIS